MNILLKIKRLFPVSACIFVLLLQSYMLIYGCSSTAGTGVVAEGYPLYASKCGSCHRLLPPEEYTAEQWRHYVDKYGKKLTQEQKQDLLDYHEQRAKKI